MGAPRSFHDGVPRHSVSVLALSGLVASNLIYAEVQLHIRMTHRDIEGIVLEQVSSDFLKFCSAACVEKEGDVVDLHDV